MKYLGIVEYDRIVNGKTVQIGGYLYKTVIFNSENNENAKQKYEKYCEETHGYIFNLYPMTEKVLFEKQNLIEIAEKI